MSGQRSSREFMNASSLHELLFEQNVDKLKYRVRLLGISAKSARKADLIEAIEEGLSASRIRGEWDLLTQIEQAAVAEACYSEGGFYDSKQVMAKYGRIPGFMRPPKDGERSFGDYFDPDRATRLNLFLYDVRYHDRRLRVPVDVAVRLQEFVSKPAPLKVPVIPEPAQEDGLFIRETEHEALSELMTLLRLAEQGNFKATEKTGMPTASGEAKILECLSGGDFFPPEIACPKDRSSYDQVIGMIKPVGWVRLLQVSGLIGKNGTRSKLSPAGIKALGKPSHELVKQVWKKWISNSKFDEFNRVDEIRGQQAKGHMTAKPERRKVILEALAQCPAKEWIDLPKFFSYMQAENFQFLVTKDSWKLYLCDREYGSLGYDGYGTWGVIQGRYLMSFLFEYAATLGLIDIAYIAPKFAMDDYRDQWGADNLTWLSRYDGLRAFRITHLGAYCLGHRDDYQSALQNTSLQLEIKADLTISLKSDILSPADSFLLETWAKPLTKKSWRLDPLKARDAVERGQDLDGFVTFLEECHEGDLPKEVLVFFKAGLENGKALKNIGEAFLYECRSVSTADRIESEKSLKKLCSRCSERQFVIPAAQRVAFEKKVRELGLGIV